MSTWIPGLAGVVAAQTSVSRVDGEGGRLWFRGRPAAEVAALGFEEAATFVLQRSMAGLGEARVLAHARQGTPTNRGMAGVRELVAGAHTEDPIHLIAEVAMAVVRVSGSTVAPDPSMDHASDLVRMLGLPAGGASALGCYLATVMDHGLNASTFAARVVASTGSDRVSAVTAAIGALKGPLHGGAPGPVLDMLDAVGDADPATWVRNEPAAGRRIMGMGHRVYQVRDPRAAALEAALAGLYTERLAVARAVEQAAEVELAVRHPHRSLRANVEFYTAILLEAIGVQRDLFTPMFAAGRVVGWLAHIDEEAAVGKILRPQSEYIGPVCAGASVDDPLA